MQGRASRQPKGVAPATLIGCRKGVGTLLADEDGGHGHGLVGKLPGKDDVAALQCVLSLLDEAAGLIVLRAPVAIERRGVDAGEVPSRPAEEVANGRDGLRLRTRGWRHGQ